MNIYVSLHSGESFCNLKISQIVIRGVRVGLTPFWWLCCPVLVFSPICSLTASFSRWFQDAHGDLFPCPHYRISKWGNTVLTVTLQVLSFFCKHQGMFPCSLLGLKCVIYPFLNQPLPDWECHTPTGWGLAFESTFPQESWDRPHWPCTSVATPGIGRGSHAEEGQNECWRKSRGLSVHAFAAAQIRNFT